MKRKVTGQAKRPYQCQKPTGWLGRLVVWSMNSRTFKADGLGPLPRLHQAAGHNPGCGLRWREDD